MAMASEEFLTTFIHTLMSGGMMARMACGMTIRRNVQLGLSPRELAASVCPWLTDKIPARTFSAM